jgi:hypothetical protein
MFVCGYGRLVGPASRGGNLDLDVPVGANRSDWAVAVGGFLVVVISSRRDLRLSFLLRAFWIVVDGGE